MSEDQPGTLLSGKYALVERVGDGGMAVVWKAITHGSSGFKRSVAIKRMLPTMSANSEMRSLFIEEARVGAELVHPAIVQVHDFGEDDHGQLYLVTELVNGPHLGDYLRTFRELKARPPWQIIVAIGVRVLQALDSAHHRIDADGNQAPVLHRDVTPQNILLDVNGVVKLADFGMARAMDRGRMTQPDVVKGKLSYLAPELVTGAGPSARSDLFSLGVVLWEALTMRRLFDAPTDFEVVEMLRKPRIPMLSVTRPDLPLGLTMTIKKALAIDPKQRFPSARDMLTELRTALRMMREPVDEFALSKSFSAAQAHLAGQRVEVTYPSP